MNNNKFRINHTAALIACLTLAAVPMLTGCADSPSSYHEHTVDVDTTKIIYWHDARTDICFADVTSTGTGTYSIDSIAYVESTQEVLALAADSDQDDALDFKKNQVSYFRDERTGICFASLDSSLSRIQDEDVNEAISITAVPATPKVLALIQSNKAHP